MDQQPTSTIGPLSFAQEPLWFLHQRGPDTPAYNRSPAFRLTGCLNVTALTNSLSEIVRRHEILRTTFGVIDGQPFQYVEAAKPLCLPLIDLQYLPETEREAEARQLAAETAQAPFDLAIRPPVWASLLRLSEEPHILLLNMHHIIADGWVRSDSGQGVGDAI